MQGPPILLLTALLASGRCHPPHAHVLGSPGHAEHQCCCRYPHEVACNWDEGTFHTSKSHQISLLPLVSDLKFSSHPQRLENVFVLSCFNEG